MGYSSGPQTSWKLLNQVSGGRLWKGDSRGISGWTFIIGLSCAWNMDRLLMEQPSYQHQATKIRVKATDKMAKCKGREGGWLLQRTWSLHLGHGPPGSRRLLSGESQPPI